MKSFILILMLSSNGFALTEKLREVVPPPEVKIENTTEKSKLRPIELDKPVVLHHREPWLLPDGKTIEVIYFSHKTISTHTNRRASVGLKISGESSETVVLHQDLDRKDREKLSTAESETYRFKLEKIIYDEEITVTISQK